METHEERHTKIDIDEFKSRTTNITPFVGCYKLPLGQYTCIGQVVACSDQQTAAATAAVAVKTAAVAMAAVVMALWR